MKSLIFKIRNKSFTSLVFYFPIASLPLYFLSLNARPITRRQRHIILFSVASKNEKIMDQVASLLQ